MHDIEKKELEKILKTKKLDSIRYVLFEYDNSMPFAVHLDWVDDKYQVNVRDERGYVEGNPFSFDQFDEAKKNFSE